MATTAQGWTSAHRETWELYKDGEMILKATEEPLGQWGTLKRNQKDPETKKMGMQLPRAGKDGSELEAGNWQKKVPNPGLERSYSSEISQSHTLVTQAKTTKAEVHRRTEVAHIRVERSQVGLGRKTDT